MIDEETGKKTSLPWFGLPKLFPFLKSCKKILICGFLLSLLISAGDVGMPLFQRYAINHYVGENTLAGLGWFCALFLVVLAVRYGVNYASMVLSSVIEVRLGRSLRQTLFDHLQTLSFSYFTRNSVGYIHARVMSDSARVAEMISWNMFDCLWQILYLIGSAVVMFSINAPLALAVCLIVPIAGFVIAIFQRRLVGVNRNIREINSHITGDFNEGIVGAKTVKTLVVEDRVYRDFTKNTSAMRKASIRAGRYRAIMGTTISFFTYVALAMVLWRGGLVSREGLMQVGTLSVFMSYAMGMVSPIEWFSMIITELISAQVNIERMDRLLHTESDVTDTPEVVEKYGTLFEGKRENWEPLRGEIEFRDVSFHYPDGEEYVLEHFNLHVPAGSNVAIVGETGAGKSTLVNLVCRFYEPTSGQVLIDGRDARERSQLWLHSNIGYVLQSPHLFSGTILDNLKYGCPDATEEQIDRALKLVCADQVVAKLDKGLQSQVGEGGDMLSTGEKQLISFARAILADPRILVLDEATSSIDTVTEKIIQDAIKTVTAGRTSFVIAHRLSTVVDADVILVIQAGKIIERGSHRELMRKKGYYYDLFTRQFDAEAVDAVL